MKMTHLQKARFAVFAYFTIAGAAVTFWAVHIPYVENKLEISHSTIGTLLLVFGAGALTAIQLVGNLIDRVGSKTATFSAALFMGLMLFLPGFANSPLFLGVALFALGIGVGATDVAMNAHAVEVERAYDRPIFSAFHAMWSFGGLLGASLGGIALANELRMEQTLSAAAIGTVLTALLMRSWMLPDKPNHKSAKSQGAENQQRAKLEISQAKISNRKVLGYVLFLGAMAAAAAIAEGTGVDWSSLHHARIIGTSEAQAAVALVVYTGAMGFTRLLIDKVVAKKGRIFVIRFGSLLSAAGTTIVVFSTSSPVALLGWIIAGIGIAGVVPQIFAYSAEVGESSHTGRNMAKVVGITYAGVLAGPALIGFLTLLVPLNIAIGLGVILGCFTALGTVVIERRNQNAKAI
jgi:predicted MFS family arabinose efflux permease